MDDGKRQNVSRTGTSTGTQKSQKGTISSLQTRGADSLRMLSITAFCIFVSVNLLAATYAPIQDCDEVFNYWEPTHYLNHGFGFETWEYSPEYAIRSWLYILVHALPGKLASYFFLKRRFEFYFIRGLLGCICAGCETHLFRAIWRAIDPRVAISFLIAMAAAPGVFHASVAYLPSSFAMYTTMMGMAAFMDTEDGLKTHKGIMWFGIGATIGWPFSAALVMPLLLEECVFTKVTGDISGMAQRITDGGIRSLIIVVRNIRQSLPDFKISSNLLSHSKWGLTCSSIIRCCSSLGASYPTTSSAAHHVARISLAQSHGISTFAICF